MKMPTQLPVSNLLSRCVEIATDWRIRLALTPADDGRWLARSLIVDVFPQRWLDNPSNIFVENEYKPPQFRRYFPDHALFLADMVDGRVIVGWFAHPEDCELKGFDQRPGHGTAVLHFRLPDLYPDVVATRLRSKRPDSSESLPWPSYDFRCSLKDANIYRPGDYEPLHARGQGHFDNFREARAKLVHAISDLNHSNYQDQDEVEIRVVDGDGWIREIRKRGTRFDVTVGGLSLSPGFVIMKHKGADVENETLGPGTVTFVLQSDDVSNEPLDFILANDAGELDRARYIQTPSPLWGTSSGHIVIEDEREDASAGTPVADEFPAPSASSNGAADALATVQLHPISLFPEGPFIRNEHLCFVLMPFAEELRLVYDEAIVPAATQADLECQRADEIMKPGGVMVQVWQAMMGARVVVADLSNMNPNVFYELGLAHAIGHNVILLTQDKKWVPFDLQHMRWVKYQLDERGLRLLRQNLGRAIRAVLGEKAQSSTSS